jgi:predicted nuclease with TOPRIM domain
MTEESLGGVLVELINTYYDHLETSIEECKLLEKRIKTLEEEISLLEEESELKDVEISLLEEELRYLENPTTNQNHITKIDYEQEP